MCNTKKPRSRVERCSSSSVSRSPKNRRCEWGDVQRRVHTHVFLTKTGTHTHITQIIIINAQVVNKTIENKSSVSRALDADGTHARTQRTCVCVVVSKCIVLNINASRALPRWRYFVSADTLWVMLGVLARSHQMFRRSAYVCVCVCLCVHVELVPTNYKSESVNKQ